MRMGRRNGYEWHYNRTWGLAGLIAAAIVLVGMRHDPTQAFSWAVAITSGVGWTRRPVRGDPTDATAGG